jgi:hypothetical protein
MFKSAADPTMRSQPQPVTAVSNNMHSMFWCDLAQQSNGLAVMQAHYVVQLLLISRPQCALMTHQQVKSPQYPGQSKSQPARKQRQQHNTPQQAQGAATPHPATPYAMLSAVLQQR